MTTTRQTDPDVYARCFDCEWQGTLVETKPDPEDPEDKMCPVCGSWYIYIAKTEKKVGSGSEGQ